MYTTAAAIFCNGTHGTAKFVTTKVKFRHGMFSLKGALQSFFSRKATLSRGLHGDSFGCILHAVSMSTSTSAHRKTHACVVRMSSSDNNKKCKQYLRVNVSKNRTYEIFRGHD